MIVHENDTLHTGNGHGECGGLLGVEHRELLAARDMNTAPGNYRTEPIAWQLAHLVGVF